MKNNLHINMLDKYFDKVYVITTFNSERVDYCKEQMKQAGVEKYEFVTSVDYRIIDKRYVSLVHKNAPAQKYMSLCANNVCLLQSAIYNNYDNICICEDDIYFEKDYKQQIKKFMDNVPDDWDMLNFAYKNEKGEVKSVNDYVNKQIGVYFGAQCVVYKKTIYNDIIKFYSSCYGNIPIDWVGKKFCKTYNIYITANYFVSQISRDYADYNFKRCSSDKLFDSLLFDYKIPSYYLPNKK